MKEKYYKGISAANRTALFLEDNKALYQNKIITPDRIWLTDMSSEIKLKCVYHGNFITTPNKHLDGFGCPLCKKSQKKRKYDIKGYFTLFSKYMVESLVILGKFPQNGDLMVHTIMNDLEKSLKLVKHKFSYFLSKNDVVTCDESTQGLQLPVLNLTQKQKLQDLFLEAILNTNSLVTSIDNDAIDLIFKTFINHYIVDYNERIQYVYFTYFENSNEIHPTNVYVPINHTLVSTDCCETYSIPPIEYSVFETNDLYNYLILSNLNN